MSDVFRWFGLDQVPTGGRGSAVTIGNFDGVHRGHQAVIAAVVEQARARDLDAVAITFDPHPVQVLRPELAPTSLTTLDDRLTLMGEAGLDGVLVLPFTRELAAWTPTAFVDRVLVRALGARVVVAGRDMRFGHRNSGTLQTLRDLGADRGFDVALVPDTGRAADASGEERGRWSSSWVRQLLAEGEVSQAAAVLGRPHRLRGPVVHGDHRGRLLGYPTANLGEAPGGGALSVPADGVYAGWVVRPGLPDSHPDHRLPAAVSIGTNPTFDGTSRRVESYVLDRTDLELYGEEIVVEFVARLRPTVRFDGIEPLLQQMGADVRECRRILAGAAVQVPVSPAASG